jgi:hypothetical protein
VEAPHLQEFKNEYECYNVKVIMVDINNSESASTVLAWMENVGVEDVTVLLQGSAAFNPYSMGYVPHNTFLDPDFIVRFTNYGYSAGNYNTWANLAEQYGEQVDFPRFMDPAWDVVVDDNGDNHPDPGESCEMTFTMGNRECFGEGTDVVAEVFCDDPDVDITNPYCTFPNIPDGDYGTSTTVSFDVAPDAEPHATVFYLTVTADNLDDPSVFEIELPIGRAHWLVVDDDGGEEDADWVVTSLNELDMYVDVWDGSEAVTSETLNNYEIVFWATGTETSPLDTDELTAAMEYMDNGGHLLLSSQYLGEQHGGSDFFSNYLHAEHTTDNMQYGWVDGIAGTPVGDGMDFYLAGGGNGAANNLSPSALTAIAPAVAFLEYADQDEYAATLYDNGTYKVIYMGFAVEAIGGLAGTDSRDEYLDAAIQWFESTEDVNDRPLVSMPDQFVMAHAYPNPFNPVTTVEINLMATADVELSFFDLLGAEVYSQSLLQLAAGKHQMEFNGADLASGVYFLRLDATRMLDGQHQIEQLKLNLVK